MSATMALWWANPRHTEVVCDDGRTWSVLHINNAGNPVIERTGFGPRVVAAPPVISPIKALLLVLASQLEPEFDGDWTKVEYELDVGTDTVGVRLTSHEIGFVFDKRNSRLQYIYNWKQ